MVASGKRFGSSCFTTDHVTCRTGSFTGSVFSGHNGITHLTDLFRGFLGNGLLQHTGFNVLHGCSRRADNLLNHMRLIIISTVNQGAESTDHLNHGTVIGLSEAVRRKIRRAHCITGKNKACGTCLSCQINIRF